jgi:hypothetical protein
VRGNLAPSPKSPRPITQGRVSAKVVVGRRNQLRHSAVWIWPRAQSGPNHQEAHTCTFPRRARANARLVASSGPTEVRACSHNQGAADVRSVRNSGARADGLTRCSKALYSITSLAQASNGRLMSALKRPADLAMAYALFGLGPRSASGQVNLTEAFIALAGSTAPSSVKASVPFRNAGHWMESFPRVPWRRCTGVLQFQGSSHRQASPRAPNNRPWSSMGLGQENRISHRSRNESRLV